MVHTTGFNDGDHLPQIISESLNAFWSSYASTKII